MRNLKQCVLFSILIFFICYDESMAADSTCGGWEPYKDEKCFKIIDETLRTYADAEKSCSQLENSSTLPIIRSKDEQDFLSNYLFETLKKVDNIWIGAKFTSNKFKWNDDSDLNFANWGEGSPRNKTNNCVQMQSDEASVGKWIDEPCEKKNLVVCQKMQNWSISHLQKSLLDARNFFTDSLNEEKNERIDFFNNVKKELDNLKQNPVPINFIYVQLPSQPEPKSLWSMVEWKDVTSDYAGLFFRAEGGGSEVFGSAQYENAPRIVQVRSSDPIACRLSTEFNSTVALNIGTTSSYIFTGDARINENHNCNGLNFEVSGGEVRPRNKAIRIWKRTK